MNVATTTSIDNLKFQQRLSALAAIGPKEVYAVNKAEEIVISTAQPNQDTAKVAKTFETWLFSHASLIDGSNELALSTFYAYWRNKKPQVTSLLSLLQSLLRNHHHFYRFVSAPPTVTKDRKYIPSPYNCLTPYLDKESYLAFHRVCHLVHDTFNARLFIARYFERTIANPRVLSAHLRSIVQYEQENVARIFLQIFFNRANSADQRTLTDSFFSSYPPENVAAFLNNSSFILTDFCYQQQVSSSFLDDLRKRFTLASLSIDLLSDSNEAANSFRSIAKISTLRMLSLRYPTVWRQEVTLSPLTRLTQLTSLSLNGFCIPENEISLIAKFLQLKRLSLHYIIADKFWGPASLTADFLKYVPASVKIFRARFRDPAQLEKSLPAILRLRSLEELGIFFNEGQSVVTDDLIDTIKLSVKSLPKFRLLEIEDDRFQFTLAPP